MGKLSFNQDGVSIAVEWPYGALRIEDFATMTKCITGIFGAAVGPAGSAGRKPIGLASSIAYDPSPPEGRVPQDQAKGGKDGS